MGACGGKPQQPQQQQKPGGDAGQTVQAETIKPNQQQQQQQPQQVAEPKPVVNLNVPAPEIPKESNMYQKFQFVLGNEVTQYLEGKHPGYDLAFEKFEKDLNIQRNEIQVYSGLLEDSYKFQDHYFEHIKEIHQKIQNLLMSEVKEMQNLNQRWNADDEVLMKRTILYLIKTRHVVKSCQDKKPKWWGPEYYHVEYDYLKLHQEQHESIWHDDLKEALLVEKNLKIRIDQRVKQIKDQMKKEEEELIQRSKQQLKDIHDEVIKRAHEDNQPDTVSQVKQLNHKYATPKVMES